MLNLFGLFCVGRRKFAEKIENELAKKSDQKKRDVEDSLTKVASDSLVVSSAPLKPPRFIQQASSPPEPEGVASTFTISAKLPKRRSTSSSSSPKSTSSKDYTSAVSCDKKSPCSTDLCVENNGEKVEKENVKLDEDRREAAKRKSDQRTENSRKNSSLLDKILLNNMNQEKPVGQNEMFYYEPSASYVGAFE